MRPLGTGMMSAIGRICCRSLLGVSRTVIPWLRDGFPERRAMMGRLKHDQGLEGVNPNFLGPWQRLRIDGPPPWG